MSAVGLVHENFRAARVSVHAALVGFPKNLGTTSSRPTTHPPAETYLYVVTDNHLEHVFNLKKGVTQNIQMTQHIEQKVLSHALRTTDICTLTTQHQYLKYVYINIRHANVCTSFSFPTASSSFSPNHAGCICAILA